MNYIIDDKVKYSLPQLETNEYELLKSSLIHEGQLAPILVFQNYIVDGITRYKILTKLGITPKYDTKTLQGCQTLDEAIDYKIIHQNSRRNINNNWRRFSMGGLYKKYKVDKRDTLKQNQNKSKESDFRLTITPETLMDSFRCNIKTLRNNELYVDRIKKICSTYKTKQYDIKAKILNDYYKLTTKELAMLVKIFDSDVKMGKKILKLTNKMKFMQAKRKVTLAKYSKTKPQASNGLINGSAEEELPNLKANSYQLALLDYPYGLARVPESDLPKNEAIELVENTAPEHYRVLKKGGLVFFFTSIENFPEYAKIYRDAGFNVRTVPIIWKKEGKDFGKYLNGVALTYEVIMLATKGDIPYFKDNNIKDVLEFPEVQNRQYLPQKPLALLEHLIEISTEEGDSVLDSTCGSGSTLISCINTNRNYLGIEKDINIFNMAKERIDKAIANKELGIKTVDKVKMKVEKEQNSKTRHLNNNNDHLIRKAE